MAIHATVAEMHPMPHIASLADGYGMPSQVIDGMDVFVVGEAVLNAIEGRRAGKGPILIEAKTERFKEHDIGTPDLAGSTPRPKAALEAMRARDPLKVGVEHALAEGWVTQAEVDALHEQAVAEVEDAEQFADDSPIARPTEAELLAAVYA
jgi:pyruvate dehydrogenase E1 component alpha subunit